MGASLLAMAKSIYYLFLLSFLCKGDVTFFDWAFLFYCYIIFRRERKLEILNCDGERNLKNSHCRKLLNFT